ncbi:MAG: hypothetical protein P8188_01700, partial [Gemmatimonadota bacterium]
AGVNAALDGTASSGFDSEGKRWLRGTLAFDAVAGLGEWALASRVFGGILWGRNPTGGATDDRWGTEFGPRERMFSPGSGDPLQRLGNPWMRSAGGGLTATGRVPGGGTLPGYSSALPFGALATGVMELAAPEWTVGPEALPVALRPVAFGGLGWGEVLDLPGTEPSDDLLASAGLGVELGLQGSPLRLRLDLPVWVSRPAWASSSREGETGFRVEVVFGAAGWN